MNRRGFLRRLGAAAVALTLARHLPGIAGTPPTLTPPEPIAAVAFKKGDVITIEGRYAFNPITRQPTEHLQNFLVTGVSDSGIVTVWPTLVSVDPNMPVRIV